MGRPKGSRNRRPFTEEQRQHYRDGAAKRRDAWAAADLAVVADMSLTASEAAAVVGRTRQAVFDKRSAMGWLGAVKDSMPVCEDGCTCHKHESVGGVKNTAVVAEKRRERDRERFRRKLGWYDNADEVLVGLRGVG